MNPDPAPPGILFRYAFWILALALVAGLTYSAVQVWKRFPQLSQLARSSPERQVFQLLRSESLSFLVTERLTSQITVEIDDSGLLLGTSSGTLTGVVRMYYGVDLARLTPASVKMERGGCVVVLPQPEVLDFAVDVSSLRFKTRRSLLRVIGDRLGNHDLRADLQNRFRSASDRFFREQSLLPDRATLCARLNDHAQSWTGRVGVSVSFR